MKLLCPVCGESLQLTDKQYRCPQNHSFDVARQGSVNLLTVQQKHSLNPLYESLKAMLQRLVSLVESMGGRSNDELKSTAQEIKAIIEKHEI